MISILHLWTFILLIDCDNAETGNEPNQSGNDNLLTTNDKNVLPGVVIELIHREFIDKEWTNLAAFTYLLPTYSAVLDRLPLSYPDLMFIFLQVSFLILFNNYRMGKHILLVLSVLFLFEKVSAQQLTPFVISSSGGFYSNNTGMLSFTTGEMSAVETFTSPSAILTQGFQQYWDFGTYIAEYPGPHFSFGIYPNPSGGHFNVIMETQHEQNVEVTVLDLLGKEMLQTSYQNQSGLTIEPIDLSDAAQGIYLISFTVNENHHGPVYHSILKIHIVR